MTTLTLDRLWLAKCDADITAGAAEREVLELRQRLAEAERRAARARRARQLLDDAWLDLNSVGEVTP